MDSALTCTLVKSARTLHSCVNGRLEKKTLRNNPGAEPLEIHHPCHSHWWNSPRMSPEPSGELLTKLRMVERCRNGPKRTRKNCRVEGPGGPKPQFNPLSGPDCNALSGSSYKSKGLPGTNFSKCRGSVWSTNGPFGTSSSSRLDSTGPSHSQKRSRCVRRPPGKPVMSSSRYFVRKWHFLTFGLIFWNFW